MFLRTREETIPEKNEGMVIHMNKQQLVEKAVEAAVEAELRFGICSRNVLIGLKTILPDMPEEMITASLSLAAGTGAASGSCGAYCAGLLGVGLKFNSTLAEEIENSDLQMAGVEKFKEYRDRFLSEWGTVLCPEIQKKLFGKSFYLVDPKQDEEFVNLEDHLEKCAIPIGAATRLAAEMILADMD